MTKIMLVDDHSLIRTGLRLLLQGDAEFCVVAEAATAAEALEKLASQSVDLMILDISMPGTMNGLECKTAAKKSQPQLYIVILSMHEDHNYIQKAMSLGANAYIPKASADSELLDALHMVINGKLYLGRNAEQTLLTSLFSTDPNHPQKCLSPRELEVFSHLIRGYRLTEVADKLQLSVKTVDTHKTKIMEKLNCKRTSELVSIALKYDMLNEQD